MRRLGIWGLEIALLLGVGAGVALADPPDDPATKPSSVAPGHFGDTLSRWMGPPEKKDPSQPVGDDWDDKPRSRNDAKTTKKPTETPIEKTSKPEPKPATVAAKAGTERDQEEQTLLRRLAVCDKLSQIAFETHDADLQRKAEQLEDRAYSLYNQKLATLPGGGATFESDEKTLEKHLGPATAGAKPNERPATASTGTDGYRAAAEEEKP